MNKEESIKNGILGFILGDAVGVPYEFKKREYIGTVDMIGNGSHNVAKGTWSDDSSMVIATMKSIIDNKGIISYKSIMDNFMLWADKKDFNINGYTFGIGRTTLNALKCYRYRDEFEQYKNPINCGQGEFKDNGNGSLMRILPIACYCYYRNLSESEVFNLVKDISSLTHSHNISVMGCFIYVLFVIQLLKGSSKEVAYLYIRSYDYSMFDKDTRSYYKRLIDDDITLLDSEDVSGLGFVVDTLEAVMWVFMSKDNYKNCVINAIKLGNDTDTIAALVGGLCGIYYMDLPNDWLNELKRKEYIIGLCLEFANAVCD